MIPVTYRLCSLLIEYHTMPPQQIIDNILKQVRYFEKMTLRSHNYYGI